LPVTFVLVMARTSHLPICGFRLLFLLSSTWGRADRHTSHDSKESGAFCFAGYLLHMGLGLHPATAIAERLGLRLPWKQAMTRIRWS
jgi:hypothetical protein